jgi:hypothetical protein
VRTLRELGDVVLVDLAEALCTRSAPATYSLSAGGCTLGRLNCAVEALGELARVLADIGEVVLEVAADGAEVDAREAALNLGPAFHGVRDRSAGVDVRVGVSVNGEEDGVEGRCGTRSSPAPPPS